MIINHKCLSQTKWIIQVIQIFLKKKHSTITDRDGIISKIKQQRAQQDYQIIALINLGLAKVILDLYLTEIQKVLKLLVD